MAFFDFLKKKPAAAPRPERPRFQLAMVLLLEPAFDAQRFTAAIGDRFPLIGTPTNVKTESVITQFDIGGASATLAMMPVRIPQDDMGSAIAASAMWDGAKTAVDKHTAHLLATVFGADSPKDAALLLSRLVSVVMDAAPVAAIYWGAANVLHEPEEFLNRALTSTSEEPPIDKWISILPAADRTGKRLFTTVGMASFGHHEVEGPLTPAKAEEHYGRIGAFAAYLITQDRTVSDGDTFGFTADDKTKVRLQPSQYDPSRTVYWLDLK